VGGRQILWQFDLGRTTAVPTCNPVPIRNGLMTRTRHVEQRPPATPGFSVLEASRWAGLPHASVCGVTTRLPG
jgi:hypothetical protein